MYIFKEYLLSLSLKFDLKILIFTVTANVGERAVQRAVFRLQPTFTPRSDRCNLSCSFYNYLLTRYSGF